ncbi:MDR/zinc-dependent alcohol dehydrogenase-like family protein [Rubinisphaera margarita]|uniref:MDR/zinc-dependent alcohol dehydrogenase-like family protein n=1 Tax=Rubinisphaera margarita TaxID=2909586 RepID=UPI001EE97631|nr:alcohol dehydrogenase catalytic domain-containing protein [Rubinisphaera margarita]MCG6158049.1 alcohol dehydrogenase catalytic domain-containing protein [Rubinisphaera margarita]
MLGLVLTANGLTVQRDLPEPQPLPHEVVLDVKLAGVCETDLQLVQGYMGFEGIPGHEFVGVPTSGRYQGQRVAPDINCCPTVRCDRCPENRHHCADRTVIGILGRSGGFAERIAVPEENLYEIPDSIPDEQAVFIEPLAAAFEILEQIEIAPRTPVTVLGDGRLGYLCSQVLDAAGGNVTVIGKHANKLERFRARGLTTIVLDELTPERNAEVVVDCTGSESGLELALKLVRPRGTIVMKTTIAGRYDLDMAQIVIDELRLVGSRCGPFPRAIEALANQEIEVESLITSRFPLQQADQALQTAAEKGQHKVLIIMDPNIESRNTR